jgi:hypothetical protein
LFALRFRLHALGEHAEIQAAAEHQHRPDDGRIVQILGHPAHEGLIDLQLVQRETLQVRQRGIAGAEVVDRELHAERLEGTQDFDAALDIDHCGAFGDFQLQVLPGKAAVDQYFLDQPGQIAGAELARRNIHRHDEIAQAPLDPVAGLGARGSQHLFADLHDQSRLFRHRDELAGGNHAPVRMLPADQRFEAGQTAPGDADLRLVMQDQFVALQRTPEAPSHLQHLARALVEVAGIASVAVAPRALDRLHRRARLLDQTAGIGASHRQHA